MKGHIEKGEQERTANNSKDFYRTTRFFRTEYKPKAYGVKDNNGNIIIQQKEGLKSWKEYFEELLNGEEEQEQNSKPKFQKFQPEMGKSSPEEVMKVIQQMKNNRAPGDDGINIEIIKTGRDIIAQKIHELKVWEKRTIPEEWSEAIIIPIDKKTTTNKIATYIGEFPYLIILTKYFPKLYCHV